MTQRLQENISRWFKIKVLCSRGKKSLSFAAPTGEILFLPHQHKIHIFEPMCNVLFII